MNSPIPSLLWSGLAGVSLLAGSLFGSVAVAAPEESGFVDLFNGKDLTGWVNVNCAPETWAVADGVITCTGQPTGALRMNRQLENFIFEVDWRHLKSGGNAGIFVWASPVAAPGVPFLRAIEVQVLDNGYHAKGKNKWYTTHGDVFPIHGASMKPIHPGGGARCFPTEERSRSAPEWNHYRIEANAGKIRLSVNGKEVSGGDDCNWRKGYLGLESEGSPTEWKNLRLKELPPGGATAAQTAPEDQHWQSLFNGLDLRGWTAAKGKDTGWHGGSWSLRRPAKPTPDDVITRTLAPAAFELTLDWRGEASANPQLLIKDASGHTALVDLVASLAENSPVSGWHRFTLSRQADGMYFQDGRVTVRVNGLDGTGPWTLELTATSAPVELANFYLRELGK
jgi:hypothetical protein